MGEFIAEMQERMLPEYEQLRNYQIFTPEQIRECVRKRERFMLNIMQSQAKMSVYFDYIIYEKQMHRTITEKEKLTGLKLAGLKASIATRIIRLYRDALRRYPHELPLWQCFIKFNKKSAPQEVAGIYEKMLSYHGDKPDVWNSAALWLYEYNAKNISRVVQILLRGLQRHPGSESLNKCLFDIQLQEAVAANNERCLGENTISEQDIGMERVEAIYRNSLKEINHLDFYLKLLESCEEHSQLTAKLQLQIIKDLQEKFPREPALWHALAQRELLGMNLMDLSKLDDDHDDDDDDDDDGGADDDGEPDKKKIRHLPATEFEWEPRTLERRIELCCQVYKTAIETLATPEMWCLYIDAMISLNKDLNVARSAKQKCLAEALQLGHSAKMMHVDHYVALCDILLSKPNGCTAAARILSEAITTDPSLRMHQLLLSVYIQDDDEPHVYELFEKSCKTLGNTKEALPIWETVIGYYEQREDAKSQQRVEKLFKLACDDTSVEFGQLRCRYLEHCWHRQQSPAKAREVYKRLALQPPISLQFHQQMAKLEASVQSTKLEDKKSWRSTYEFMTSYFGKSEPQVWLDYIAFERDHGNPHYISLLSTRALSTLHPELASSFQAKRSLQHNNASISTTTTTTTTSTLALAQV